MNNRLIFELVRRDFRDHFLRPWTFAFELFKIVFELMIYWYTSKAFTGAFAGQLTGQTYFEYVVIGELTLFVPVMAFASVHRMFFTYVNDGIFHYVSATARKPQRFLLLAACALLPRYWLHTAAFYVCAKTIFSFTLAPGQLLALITLQILSIPALLGLSMAATAAQIRFQRGGGLLATLDHVLAVFAGLYFPLSVLPETLQYASRAGSPFTA
ncbi:MAG TPA: hypothetical protein VFV50_17035, partial [Bdellovibrionales bacterium]|nr:hypothetical protein [Bdellovibrionales bacterium]